MQYAGRIELVGDEITHYRSGCLEAIHLAAWPHCRINVYIREPCSTVAVENQDSVEQHGID